MNRIALWLGLGACWLALALASAADAKTARVNINNDPPTIDPISASENTSYRIVNDVYESFTALTADGKNVPALAESWEPLEPGPGFRFHLRHGVKFHSGRSFTAKDVKYTFEALLTPGPRPGFNATYLADVVGAAEMKAGTSKELAGVRIVDDYTLEVLFARPSVIFPIYPIWIMDSGVEAEQGPDWVTKVSAGTGPFQFKQWRRGVEVEVAAFPGYWGGTPKMDGIRYLVIPSGDTVLTEYDAGELDVADPQDATFRRILQDARYKEQILLAPRATVRYIGLNQTLVPVFKDKRVREAISLSIDRDAMIKGFFGGIAIRSDGFVTPNFAGYNSELPPLDYNPDRARQLLTEAGFPGGRGFPPIQISATAPFKDELAYYASQLNKVLGIQVDVNLVERSTFIKSMTLGEVPFFAWQWTASYFDPIVYLGEMWYSMILYGNRSRWKNAEYDKLIDQARLILDTDKRYQVYHQAEKILREEWAAAPLPISQTMGLRKPYVHNARLSPVGFIVTRDLTLD